MNSNGEEERLALNKTVPREQYRRQRERSNALENVLEEVRAIVAQSVIHDEFCEEGYTEPEPITNRMRVLPCNCWVSELREILKARPALSLRYRDNLTAAQALDDFVEVTAFNADWREEARERAVAIRKMVDK